MKGLLIIFDHLSLGIKRDVALMSVLRRATQYAPAYCIHTSSLYLPQAGTNCFCFFLCNANSHKASHTFILLLPKSMVSTEAILGSTLRYVHAKI